MFKKQRKKGQGVFFLERVLSDEEKFRKAEEIYQRRRNINVTVPSRDLNRNTQKKDKKRFKFKHKQKAAS